MSQKRETSDTDGRGKTDELTLESLQQFLSAQAEDRDAAAERTESFLARFFKLAIVIVCLNTVIAGANIALVLRRSNSSPTPPSPVPAPLVMAEPTQPVPVPQTPAAAPQGPIAEPAQPPTTQAPPELPTPSPVLASPQKRIPLLGPLPSSSKGLPLLAKRQVRPLLKPTLANPVASVEEAEEELNGPSSPPERW